MVQIKRSLSNLFYELRFKDYTIITMNFHFALPDFSWGIHEHIILWHFNVIKAILLPFLSYVAR